MKLNEPELEVVQRGTSQVRVTPRVPPEQFLRAVYQATSMQDAIDSTGLPSDIIDQRVRLLKRQFARIGKVFPALPWLYEYRVSRRKSPGGRVGTDYGALADLVGAEDMTEDEVAAYAARRARHKPNGA